MSRYGVDKAMREIILMSEEAFQAYMQDPMAFLQGRHLSDTERESLVKVDYPTLYAQGAHPFLLNGFARRAWPGDRVALREQYGKSLEALGYPDFSTP